MPKGFTAIKQAADRIKERSEDFGPPVTFLKLPNDGSEATVRFLEQGEEVYSYYYHDFSHIDPPNGWKTKLPCLDQDDQGVPCPGCREDLPRKFEGLINVIWRNGPVYKRDEEGKLVKNGDNLVQVGEKDQVAVWRGGINLFKTLGRKDHAYKGLGTRDFQIVREGLKLKTTYSIEPADVDQGAVPLSSSDEKLAAEKYDLQKVARFVSEEKMDEIIAGKMNGHSTDDDVEEFKQFMNESPLSED